MFFGVLGLSGLRILLSYFWPAPLQRPKASGFVLFLVTPPQQSSQKKVPKYYARGISTFSETYTRQICKCQKFHFLTGQKNKFPTEILITHQNKTKIFGRRFFNEGANCAAGIMRRRSAGPLVAL